MASPLYPVFDKRISDATESLIREKVTPWAFLSSGKPFRMAKHNGEEIRWEGILYHGTPSLVFWTRFIDPYLEELVLNEFNFAVEQAKERDLDAKVLLPEVKGLLIAASSKVFDRMISVDQNLRGGGDPRSVSPRSATQEIHQLTEFIDKHYQSQLDMWKPLPKREKWFRENQFIVWVVAILLALIPIIASCVKNGS
ncbi:hypothetical protein ACUHMQ_06690 [Chitinimonas sp. PSY-7]|uniref:hypothetical protein n=1 Tax=Chitinimonas sp. PSY-7 TaxID=3459088 RepID=UPI0040403D1E